MISTNKLININSLHFIFISLDSIILNSILNKLSFMLQREGLRKPTLNRCGTGGHAEE